MLVVIDFCMLWFEEGLKTCIYLLEMIVVSMRRLMEQSIWMDCELIGYLGVDIKTWSPLMDNC